MQTLEAIALIVVTIAGTIYIYRSVAAYRKARAQRRVVEQAFANTPERRIASLLGEARRTMSAEDYKQAEKEVLATIEQHNVEVRGKEDLP